ncbi:MAG TPA: phosphatidate cytidylyltransferase [Solirubrobacteraceae bacterium]|nr:phosphatidate cytidylyltransferase [Solirubrobacteraceae bacterium]
MGSSPHTPGGARAASRRPQPRGRRRARRPPRRRGGSDLGQRVLVALPLIAIALFLVITGGWVFAVGLFVFGAICMHELFEMYAGAHPVRLAAFLALAGLLAAGALGGPTQVLLATVLSLPFVFAVGLALPRASVASLAITMLGIVWIGLALAHAVMLRGLAHGEGIVLDVAVGAFVCDTFAYFGGRAFGSRRLAPAISPSKTVEGLLIGMLAAVAAVWIAGRYQEWLPGHTALLLGVGVAVTAPIGDLFESFVKREADAKDSGTLFRSHGGVLDRIDGLLFAVVAGYYIWLAHLH